MRSCDLASNPVQTVSPSYPEDWAFTRALSASFLVPGPFPLPGFLPWGATKGSTGLRGFPNTCTPLYLMGPSCPHFRDGRGDTGRSLPKSHSAAKRHEGPGSMQGTAHPAWVPWPVHQTKGNYRCFAAGKRPHPIMTVLATDRLQVCSHPLRSSSSALPQLACW